ncbi:CHAT domain-containing protein [Aurantibacter crassamenti]|uniref:CHAT domain-containing protein n=1 Tax=Aurantibacter crassamenti TaxID=1837375 RepID=UPI00193962BA|nr:CHAT domain-containing protein [Aurantibacter crassamenti]MBM1105705.1 CHAT domain-containing protein [Aurantibacter crassamenti]
MKNLMLCFLFISTVCYGQHDELLSIIDSDAEIDVIQQKIDSFFIVHQASMTKSVLADCYHDLGSKWYYSIWHENGKIENIQNAIEVTEKASALKKNLDSLDYDSLKKTLYNLGYFNSVNGNIFEAIDAYTDLIDLGNDERRTQNARRELGRCYRLIGDFHKSIENFQKVSDFYKNDSHNSYKYIDANIDLAGTYEKMGYEEYSVEIKTQVEKVDALFKIQAVDSDIYQQLQTMQIEGNRLLSIGNYNQAIQYHSKMLGEHLELSSYDLARVFNSIAFSQMKLENFDLAKENLLKAIELDTTYSDPYENLGDWHLAQNEYEKGLYFYQKAIVLASSKKKEILYDELLTKSELELASNKVSLLNHIVTKANGWMQYYEHDDNRDHLEHALKTFNLADQLVDIIRSESSEEQSKLFWREKGSSLYMKAVEACYHLKKPERAYYFMERNKALLLLENVTNEQAKEIASLPDSIAKQEYELKRAIFLAENELQNSELAEEKKTEMKDEIYKSKRRFEQFSDSMIANFPNYANLKKNVEILSHQSFKKKFISKDEVVLQFILNDEKGYGLLSSDTQTVFYELENVENLNERIIELYGQLTDLVSSREKIKKFNTNSNFVFNKLIPDKVYQQIKGKKLTVVSDYILQQLPLETMVTDIDTSHYLIEDTDIRYAYSISYLQAKNQISGQAKNEMLGVAPVSFAALQLPDLTFSGEEITEAEKIFEGRSLLRDEATKRQLLDNLNDYRIIHLSTHADISEKQNHWIALNDEKLYLNEIYANKNQAEMVVLSACNTSLGELKKGEGVMSLARGFFHSGAKSVVSSLWTTNDKASKDIMTAFYKELDKGLTKSAALRNAKVAYINKYRGTNISPAYWGALIVIGDNSPIQNVGLLNGNLKWVIIVLLIVAAVFVFVRKRNV